MKDNLPILEDCADCGACCVVTGVPPFVLIDGVHEGIVREVPPELLNPIMLDWNIRTSIPERPCLWYDEQTKTCRHYEHRPQACRDFEINSASCHAVREATQIVSHSSE